MLRPGRSASPHHLLEAPRASALLHSDEPEPRLECAVGLLALCSERREATSDLFHVATSLRQAHHARDLRSHLGPTSTVGVGALLAEPVRSPAGCGVGSPRDLAMTRT